MKYLYAFLCAAVLLATPILKGAAQQAAQQPAQQPNEAIPIQLKLENDIRDVIDIIADALQLNIVVDPAVRGTVKIRTNTTLLRSDLMPILETILKLNAATMLKTGNFYQIVPSATAVRQPLDVQERAEAGPADDQMVVEIIRMKFIAAAEMAKLLTPYIGEGGNIVVHEAGSILLVTDRRSNLRKVLELVDAFDTNTFGGDGVRLFSARNTVAKDLAEDLKSVFGGSNASRSSAIGFIPIERTNQILVISPNPAAFPEVEKWIGLLDQSDSTAGIRTFVYKAKFGRAQDLQRVLVPLYSSGTFAPAFDPSNPGAGAAAVATAAQAAQAAGQLPNSPTAPVTNSRLLQSAANYIQTSDPKVRIIADEINNYLVIQAPPQVIADMERTLMQLDVLRRQVLIDAQIYEVNLNDATALGISAMLQNRTALPGSTTGSFAAPPSGGAPSLSFQTFAYIGRTREFLFLNASENRSRVKTVSAPSVLVSDNMPAQFQVGTEVPVPTSSSLTPVQSGGTNLFVNTIQFRDTGVILNVKPQVNEGGSVSLDIKQEVSQASANTTSGIVAPVIGKSSVTSTVVVENGQTIALGGFIRESEDYQRDRIPIVGQIPVMGALFGSTTKSKVRSELIILITPHVLENRADADLATEELKSKVKKIQELMKLP